jgi:hypothetical protein
MDDTGIIATVFIEKEHLHRNDSDRLDGRSDYISTSIQYPNVWYYRYKRNVNPMSNDWAVIFIDTEICKRANTLFSPINAATGKGAYIGTGAKSLSATFDETVCGRSRTPYMFDNCPTDDQAEVMLHKEIPTSYITGIAFESMDVIDKFIDLANNYSLCHPNLYLAPDLFTTALSKKIRLGIKPEETIVEEESLLWQKDLCS